MMQDWIAAARPKTLPAAVVPIMIGSAESYRLDAFDWWPAAICLAFSLLTQIATNMANDYYDHVRGADTDERVGPERLVAAGKIAPRSMLVASLAIFGIAFLVGLNLVAYRGWELLAIGALSILFGYGYSGGPFPLAYRGLGDVFVVLFFGLVATMGTCYVITGTLAWPVAALGLALGLLANNILVVNNYRDMETDLKAGKLTLIARRGRGFGRTQYLGQLLAACGSIALYVAISGSGWALLGILTLPMGIRVSRALRQAEGRALNGLLAKTAGLLLLTGTLTAVGIVIG